nr:PREDICTED: synaptotagmin-4 isoform X2 [Bemisia tabaci]
MLEVLVSVSHFAVSTPAVVGICLGTTLFLTMVGAATCFCYRRRYVTIGRNKLSGEKTLVFQHRRSTAVRSPACSQTTTHYLKKTPSPSSCAPSLCGSGANSPTGTAPSARISPRNSPTSEQPPAQPSAEGVVAVKMHTENECVPLPPKEETEPSEKSKVLQEQNGSGKLGQLFFKLRYKKEKSILIVSVLKCRNLPAKDASTGNCDPYIKLQLLPDKQHKVKTRVLRKTRNPIYDEDFTFYGINTNQLQSITLHFAVLSFDRYSRDDIIGEVFAPLSSIDLAHLENQQISLCRDIQPRSMKIRSQGRGELLVSLCWQPAANRITVVVLKARNLPKMDVTGLADPYVKMYLLYNGQRVAKKKTHVKKRTLNPVFNESFVFEIPNGADSLANISLEFLLLDWDRVTKNEVIGRLELGGAKNTGPALHHWNEVCNSPRRQIAEWHKLRE